MIFEIISTFFHKVHSSVPGPGDWYNWLFLIVSVDLKPELSDTNNINIWIMTYACLDSIIIKFLLSKHQQSIIFPGKVKILLIKMWLNFINSVIYEVLTVICSCPSPNQFITFRRDSIMPQDTNASPPARNTQWRNMLESSIKSMLWTKCLSKLKSLPSSICLRYGTVRCDFTSSGSYGRISVMISKFSLSFCKF